MATSLTAAWVASALAHLLPAPAGFEGAARRDTITAATVAAVEATPQWRWSKRELAASLAVIVRFESNADAWVHHGVIVGRAGEVCLTQIHPVVRPFVERLGFEWSDLTGSDLASTTACLRVAAALLSSHRAYCESRRYFKNWDQAMFARYHRGNGCWGSPHQKKRALALRSVLAVASDHADLSAPLAQVLAPPRSSPPRVSAFIGGFVGQRHEQPALFF